MQYFSRDNNIVNFKALHVELNRTILTKKSLQNWNTPLMSTLLYEK